MKCLSIRQPHLAAILAGVKRTEYRTWTCSHRGKLLLHASRTVDEDDGCYGHLSPALLSRGVILGAVEVTDIQRVEDAYDGTVYDWHLVRPVIFREPIRFTGKLNLFEVPDQLVAAQLEAAA